MEKINTNNAKALDEALEILKENWRSGNNQH